MAPLAQTLSFNETVCIGLFHRPESLSSLSSLCDNHYKQPKSQVSITTTSKPKKSVTFNNKKRIRPTLHINNYTPEEKAATWYQKSEYRQIKIDNKKIVSKMTDDCVSVDDICEENNECTRGLESRTQREAAKKVMIRMSAQIAVLDEQDYQMNEGISEPEDIANVYRYHSQMSMEAARLMGLKDEREAYQRMKV